MIRLLLNWWKRRKAEIYREWASVPNPEWRASRGGRDYW